MTINKNSIILGDCLSGLKEIEDNTFDVAFTSPPYGDIGTESFEEINENYEEMLNFMRFTGNKDYIANNLITATRNLKLAKGELFYD